MQWNEEMNSGFTTSTPWISVAENFKEINVEKALEDKESVFYHYKELIELRKTYDVITEGEYAILDENDPKIWAYTRTTESEVLLVINNFYNTRRPAVWYTTFYFKTPLYKMLTSTSGLNFTFA